MVKPKRYSEAALMRKILRTAQEFLELQRLRIEVERAEMRQKKRRKPHQHDNKKKR